MKPLRVVGTAVPRADDGRLDVKLSSPGTKGTDANPEQLPPPVGRPAS